MKKPAILLLLATWFCVANVYSQSPEAFNYQAIIRDASGQLVISQDVAIKISIVSSSTNGAVEYAETHNVTTSSVGSVVLQIGGGDVLIGDFETIDWGADSHFVQTAIDLDNGTDFSVISTTQLLSVPYALHAKTSGDRLWEETENDIYLPSGKVGIGTRAPFAPLSVTLDTSAISSSSFTALADFQRTVGNSTSRFLIYGYPDSDSVRDHVRKSVMLYATGDAKDMIFNAAQSDGRIRFFTQSWAFPANERMTIAANGNVGIGNTTPAYKMDVLGSVNARQYLLNGEEVALDHPWSSTDSTVYKATGSVGIGTTSPAYDLDVAGQVNATEYLLGGETLLFDHPWLNAGSDLYYPGGKVGIGTDAPYSPLSVVLDTGVIFSNSLTSLADFQRTYNNSTARFLIYGYPDATEVHSHIRKSVMLYATNDAKDMILTAANTSGRIRFFTQSWLDPNNERMVIDSTGNVGIGTNAPAYKLDVSGNVNASGLYIGGQEIQFNQPWDVTDSTISYANGKVGIGNGVPAYDLDVAGQVNASEYYLDGEALTFDRPWLQSGSDLYYSGGNVGIGTNAPYSPLSVVLDTGVIASNSLTSLADFQRTYNNSTARFLIYGYPDATDIYDHVRKSVMLYATNDAQDMILTAANTSGRIRFFTQSWLDPNNERMVIDSTGNVGIGTTAPAAKVHVTSGDVYIDDISSGVIMKSPDGNCWRMTVDNSGNMVTTSITCPAQ